ncbi:MAG: PHP domain-containing protein [Selenomonadaceae bacterium]|nr:PHP domain-containing protein [Selenomonadaceae bacterium]
MSNISVSAEGLIDLHVHSTISDGTYTPRELVELVKRRRMAGFALTDHDLINGLDEAESAAREMGVRFLPGMELTLNFRSRRIHVVAYGFDRESYAFKNLYRMIRANKERGMEEVVNFVRDKGLDLTVEEVKASMTSAFDVYAIMRCITRRFPDSKVMPLWDKYIYSALDYLGLNMDIAPKAAFTAIHKAGGVLSLAHFHKRIGLQGLSRQEQEESIAALVDMGLDGMEKYYPSYTDDDRAFAAATIEKFNLMATGGSDYHGENRTDTEIGTGIDNNLAVPAEFFDGVEARIAQVRSKM